VTPDYYLGRARRAIASARILLEDGDLEGACNRAYYCMFDAAKATLTTAEPGRNPTLAKTHRGLIAAFSQNVVKTGLLSADLGRSLNQVERIRLLADYTGEAIDEAKVRWAIDQAAAFLEQVERHLGNASPRKSQ